MRSAVPSAQACLGPPSDHWAISTHTLYNKHFVTMSSSPAQSLHINGRLPASDLHAAIIAACKVLLTDWAQLPECSLCVTLIVGGISNSLFKVGPLEGSTPVPVMLRIYGDNTEAFIGQLEGGCRGRRGNGLLCPGALLLHTSGWLHCSDRKKEMATMRLLHRNGFGPEVGLQKLGRMQCLVIGFVAEVALQLLPS